VKNIFRRINENGVTGKNSQEREIIELGFKYMTSKLRRHNSEKIGKDKHKKEEKAEMRPMKKNGGSYDEETNKKEIRELEMKYDGQLTAVHRAIGKLKEAQNLRNEMRLNNDYFNYEDENIPPSRETLNRLELLTLAEISKVEEKAFGGRKPKTLYELEDLCDQNDWEEQVESWKTGVEALKTNAMAERVRRISYIRQMQYADDPKRVFNWLIRDRTPMCEIDPDVLRTFF
jgi:hypothetical protein